MNDPCGDGKKNNNYKNKVRQRKSKIDDDNEILDKKASSDEIATNISIPKKEHISDPKNMDTRNNNSNQKFVAHDNMKKGNEHAGGKYKNNRNNDNMTRKDRLHGKGNNENSKQGFDTILSFIILLLLLYSILNRIQKL